MVTLKNIKIENDVLLCDLYPEDSRLPGRISYRVSSNELESYELPKGYEWCDNHIAHAVRKIEALIKEKTIPTIVHVVWC